MTTRAVFVPGTWQLVNAVAALSQEHTRDEGERADVLVLYGSGSRAEFRASLSRMAEAVWSWKKVVWADDLMIAHFPTRAFAPLFSEMIRKRTGADVGEVWIPKPYCDPAKLAINAYPGCPVVVYEDGAEEFLEQPVTCGRGRLGRLPPTAWPGGLRRELSHWTDKPECLALLGICERQRKRFRAFYSFLYDHFDLPSQWAGVPVERIRPGALCSVLAQLRALQEQESGPAPIIEDSRAVLFLPQPFTAPGSLTADEEYELYSTAVSRIVKEGYRVLWKEHPRETKPLGARIIEEFGVDQVALLASIHAMPVEALVQGWTLGGVVSVASSALLYLKGLYGIPAYSLVDMVPAERWKQDVDARLAVLFATRLQGLDALPPTKNE